MVRRSDPRHRPHPLRVGRVRATSSCAAGTTADAIEEHAAGGSGLQNLGDGVPRQARFQFTR